MTKDEIRNRLFEMKDDEYKVFQLNLMPGVEPDTVLGVRTPLLRKFSKEVFKSKDYDDFLNDFPHKYYDEMNLHGFVLCEIKDYDKVVGELDKFLPYVNNWATCDLLNPKKAFAKNLDRLIIDIKRWIASEDTYTIRFGIEMLMSYFLDENFLPEYNDIVASVRSEEYYVNMMKAWYFATALAKQYDATISVIENRALDEWTHRKSIQKARESYRITAEQKEYLKSLK